MSDLEQHRDAFEQQTSRLRRKLEYLADYGETAYREVGQIETALAMVRDTDQNSVTDLEEAIQTMRCIR